VKRFAARNQPQTAGHGCEVVDQLTSGVLLGEEGGLREFLERSKQVIAAGRNEFVPTSNVANFS
jgi:hypothetical protein